jgi:glutamate synthase (NADPH/NADH) small chain
MPELCSRVCPQERLCEGSCILNGRSEAVTIGAIERFINEYAFACDAVASDRAPKNGLRVAVIGAGPGGLACADELAKFGYEVTVFEALSKAGGLLRYGIPSFKLEKELVDRRINVLLKRGVEFRFGAAVGCDVSFAELRKSYDALFLGIGAQKPRALDIPGADLEGVMQALPFLIKHIEQGRIGVLEGKRVVVLGGGDTAMDCLRTAVRCGAAQAVCLYRRDLANMPGSRKEYQNALEEGARFEFLANPVALKASETGRVSGVTCVRMELGEPDVQGRRKPRPVQGSEFTVAADLVLAAYGFDPAPFPPGTELAEVAVNDWGAAVVDCNQMTSLPGVFAGGDIVRGPSLVVHAVRDGRKAAQGINRYLATRIPS